MASKTEPTYQVLARKWRPQNFDELVGQQHLTRTLANAIEADRLAHAYIFAGLRGTGKTTVARILAKCLNCEKGPTNSPCDGCASCDEVAQSRSMDVLEIDAASRTKVEQTRELLEMVNYAPVRDRYKVLIIDEAYGLNEGSYGQIAINTLVSMVHNKPGEDIAIIMLGYEGEEEEDIEATLRFVKRAKPDAFLTTLAYPIKGTPLYDDVQGLMTSGQWSQSDDVELLFRNRYPARFYRWTVFRLNISLRLRRTLGRRDSVPLRAFEALGRAIAMVLAVEDEAWSST